MIRNTRAYELAFEFRNEKPWERFHDSQVFGIRFSDGSIGYASIMGAMGEYTALGIYDDEDALKIIFDNISNAPVSEFEALEQSIGQRCIQVVFDDKENLDDLELSYVKKYAKQNHMGLRGKDAYPHFLKFRAGYVPWNGFTEEEEKRLIEGLEVALKVIKEVEPIEISDILDSESSVSVFGIDDDGLTKESVDIDFSVMTESYPSPSAPDEFTAARLRKLRKAGAFEAEIVMIPEPVVEDDSEIPFFPYTILMAPQGDFNVPYFDLVKDYDANSDELMSFVIDGLIEAGLCPRKFYVRDVRTRLFLKNLGEAIGASVVMRDSLPSLDELEYAFMDMMEKDMYDNTMDDLEEYEDMLEFMEMLSDAELRTMPKDVQKSIRSVYEDPALPADLKVRTGNILDRLGKRPSRRH